MRRFGMRALLAGVMSMGLASTAWAGFANRTDLVDVDNSMAADTVDSPAAANNAFMHLSTDVAFGSGSINNGGVSSTFTGIHWWVFEPDQTKRNTNGTGGSLQQKDQLALSVMVNGVLKFSGNLTGCQGKIQAKAPKGSLLPSTVSGAQWSVNCNNKAVQASGISSTDMATLQTALGKKVVGKNSLNIKGKCTAANCDL